MMEASHLLPGRFCFMSKDPSKTKRCPACKLITETATMRPLARAAQSGVRLVCAECYAEAMAQRKSVIREADK
jgi:hypothetical protein